MSEDKFDGSPISRRRFVELSAATGVALTLPGNSTANVQSENFTAEYQYVLNHTPDDYRAPTLVRFSDSTGPDEMDTLLGDGAVVETTIEPEPAAYGQLTTSQASAVADIPSAAEFQFSPGSNPFWRIGYYPTGIFPEPRRSIDYIGFEQLKDGLEELEHRATSDDFDTYRNRIRVKNVGRSPGHHNNVTDRPDPKGMYVAELTNFDSDVPFEDKEKVFFSCSLHGLEMAGRETGARVLENVVRGSEPDVAGSDAKLEPLLDDVVVIIGFVNPDGWAVRNPQYDSGWQVLNGPRVPAAPLYERGNAEVYDTNRQYPVVGYIDPSYYPAAPANYQGDEPTHVHEKVPDAKAFVDFFQTYENLNYGADLHGGPVFNEFVLGLISQDQFNTRELHEVYEMCLNIDETLAQALDTWQTVGDFRTENFGDEQYDPVLYGVVPSEAFDYATIYDTIGYTVSGAFLDWMAHPEPIGLDMTTLDFEMSFNHMVGGNVYNPELFEMEVTGYRAAIRTIVQFAVNNTDTPTTDEQFSTRTETGGDSVAYVTTGEVGSAADALRRTDSQLPFPTDPDTETAYYEDTQALTLSGETTEATFDVEEADLHSMGVHMHGQGVIADLELVDPEGEVVREFQGVTEDRVGGKCCGLPEFTVSDPAVGTWRLRATSYREESQPVEVKTWMLAALASPDPRSVDNWGGEGYEQSAYDVTPFQFFEDYQAAEKNDILREFIQDGGSLEQVTVGEVKDGALSAYDHAVVIHDYVSPTERISEGVSENATEGVEEGVVDPEYTAALDDFVDAGGNLVVTDTGTYVLPHLENELFDGSAIDPATHLERQYLDVARFTDKDLSHPLFSDNVRPIQEQLWKVQPLGYQVNSSAPMDLVAEEAFTGAANDGVASIAGWTNDLVATGSVTEAEDSGRGIHYISSLLPPATQANLHPFGLQNYTVTFLGNLLFTSALGFKQIRDAGDTIREYGRGDEWSVEPPEDPTEEFTASGSRELNSQVVSGRQATQVDVTVEDVADEARTYDHIPDNWRLLERFSDAEVADEEEGRIRLFDRDSFEDSADSEDTVSSGDTPVTFTYFVESPDNLDESGPSTFGPGLAEAVNAEDFETDEAEFAGEDDALVVAYDL